MLLEKEQILNFLISFLKRNPEAGPFEKDIGKHC